MKSIVVYNTVYGSTEKYAKLIAEKSGSEIFNLKTDLKKIDLSKADIVCFGGPVHAGKIQGADWLNKNINQITNKKLLLFSVSAAPPSAPVVPAFKTQSLSQELHDCAFFPLPGRYVFSEMSWFHRSMIKLAAKFIKDPMMREGILTETRSFDPEKINPIVEWIREQK